MVDFPLSTGRHGYWSEQHVRSFFEQLLSYRIVGVFGEADWNECRQEIDRLDLKSVTIGSVAQFYGLPWPRGRSEESFELYSGSTLAELLQRPSLGRKKIAALITCIATMVLDEEQKTLGKSRQVEEVPQPGKSLWPDLRTAVRLHDFLTRNPGGVSASVWDQWRESSASVAWSDRLMDDVACRVGLSWPEPRRNEIVGDYLNLTWRELRAKRSFGKRKQALVISCVAAVAGVLEEEDLSEVAQVAGVVGDGAVDVDSAGKSVQEITQWALLGLSDRQREVLTRRLGLDDHQRETLHEIAVDKQFGLTRERIRQIEKAAMRKLRTLTRMVSLSDALNREASGIWQQLVDQDVVVRKNELRRLRLSWEFQLAFAISGSLEAWLNAEASAFGDGWFRGTVSCEALDVLVGRVRGWLEDRDGTASFNRIRAALQVDETDLRIATELDPSLSLFCGYVCVGRLTLRKRRRIHLHHSLRATAGDKCVPAIEALQLLHQFAGGDRCSIRDAEIVMDDSPSLFLRCAEAGWIALGRSEAYPRWASMAERSQEIPSLRRETVTKDSNTETDTQAGTTRSILQKNGPCHVSKILKLFKELNPEAYVKSSVCAILTMGNYVRLAPGVWGLPEHYRELTEAFQWADVLLTEADCRTYAFARHAGEPIGTYPMWTAAMEHRWAVWANGHVKEEVYTSFLAICDPDAWPVSEEERSHWHGVKQHRGQYRLLAVRRFRIDETIPTLLNLLRVAYVASTHGHVNWMAANRVVGRRIDSHRSAAALAVLVELGILEAPDHWQRSHRATESCESFVHELTEVLIDGGAVAWNTEVGRNVVARLTSADHGSRHSWLSDIEQRALRARYTQSSVEEETIDEGAHSAFDVLHPDLDHFLGES
jgi:hypothetical protein